MPCLYQHIPRVKSSSLMPFWIQFHFLIDVQRMMAPNKSNFLLAGTVSTRECCMKYSRRCSTHKEKDIRYISGNCTTQWSHLRNLIFSEMINQPEHQNTHEYKYKQNKSFIYLNFKSTINYSHSQSPAPPRDERSSDTAIKIYKYSPLMLFAQFLRTNCNNKNYDYKKYLKKIENNKIMNEKKKQKKPTTTKTTNRVFMNGTGDDEEVIKEFISSSYYTFHN